MATFLPEPCLTSDLCFQEEVCVAGCWHHCITCELSDVNPIPLAVLPKQGWYITQQALPTASHPSSWPFQHRGGAFNFKQRRLILLNGYHVQRTCSCCQNLSLGCQISHLSSWGSLLGTTNINILMLYSTALRSVCFCKCQMPCYSLGFTCITFWKGHAEPVGKSHSATWGCVDTTFSTQGFSAAVHWFTSLKSEDELMHHKYTE